MAAVRRELKWRRSDSLGDDWWGLCEAPPQHSLLVGDRGRIHRREREHRGRAGSDFGFTLAWALLFSVVACLVLQEAAGRITVVTGKELGEAIRARFGGWVPALVAGGIVLGCAAYEAGNLLGGVAGLRLVTDVSPGVLTLVAGIGAALLLATGNTRWIARILGALVALMGIAFVITAVRLGPDLLQLADGLFIPRIPAGSTVLVLGLVGTTVVP